MAEIKQQEKAQAAPQNIQAAAAPQQPPQPQARPCPKDCRRCSMQQQICCASMLSFQAFDVMNSIIRRLDIQSQRINDLEAKLSTIQNTEAELSSPLPFQDSLFAGAE